MTNIEKIRQEIERRLKYTHDWLRGDEKRHPKQTAISKNYYKMKGDERTLDALLSFIDSLPEEKPSDDLKEEIQRIVAEYSEKVQSAKVMKPSGVEKIARHFYELGKQSKGPVSEDLEEAAEISFDEARALTEDYRDFLAKGLTENRPRPIGPHWFCEYAKNRFIAGAEWAFRQGWTFDAHKGAFGICFDGNIDNLLDSLKDKEEVTVQIRKK